ncbi:MAG: transposase [Chromatiales bacterium]|nr:transposase [Chromatiales bacterium]
MPPHAKDLRKGRVSEPGRIYLITTVTHDRARILDNLIAARIAAQEIQRPHSSGKISSLAWVLMPDHLHWLLQLNAGELSRVVQQFKSRSAIALNQARQGHGQVWQAGFHDRALRLDEDLRSVARYLIANPLRAGLAERVGDWPYWDAVWLDQI